MANVTSLAKAKELSRAVWKYQNEVRQNPKILIPLLEEDLKYFQGKSIWAPGQPGMATDEGPSAWNETIEFVNSQSPLPPLEWNDALEAAAIDHAFDLGPKGKTGHVGSDNSTIGERIKRHGKWLVTVGENISFGPAEAMYIVKQLIIDDGTPGRGHRTNLFNPDYRLVGVGAAPHAVYGSVCVLDYAGGMSPDGTSNYQPRIDLRVFDIAKKKQEHLAKATALAEELPLACVSRSVKTNTKISGTSKVVTTTTVYKFADGHEETKVEVNQSVASKGLSPAKSKVGTGAPGPEAPRRPPAQATPMRAVAAAAAPALPRKPALKGAVPFEHMHGRDKPSIAAAGALTGLIQQYDSLQQDSIPQENPAGRIPAPALAPAPRAPMLSAAARAPSLRGVAAPPPARRTIARA